MLLQTLPRSMTLHLPDEAATEAFGTALGGALAAGDTLLLSGPLGAGKSALARAAIRRLLGDRRAEVPSPSYSLVNVYETDAGQVWHADLYRLGGGGDEMAELGLDEAMGQVVLFVEWPDRLGAALPERFLSIHLDMPDGGGRGVAVAIHGAGWEGLRAVLEDWE